MKSQLTVVAICLCDSPLRDIPKSLAHELAAFLLQAGISGAPFPLFRETWPNRVGVVVQAWVVLLLWGFVLLCSSWPYTGLWRRCRTYLFFNRCPQYLHLPLTMTLACATPLAIRSSVLWPRWAWPGPLAVLAPSETRLRVQNAHLQPGQ